MFLTDWNDFCCKPIPKNAKFTCIEKILEKNLLYFLKKSPYLLDDPCIYIYTYTYIYMYVMYAFSVIIIRIYILKNIQLG